MNEDRYGVRFADGRWEVYNRLTGGVVTSTGSIMHAALFADRMNAYGAPTSTEDEN